MFLVAKEHSSIKIKIMPLTVDDLGGQVVDEEENRTILSSYGFKFHYNLFNPVIF